MSTKATLPKTSSSSTPTLQLPILRADQRAILNAYNGGAKTCVVVMGRRWGKSVLGGTIAVFLAQGGLRVAWIVPSYKNGRPLWRWIIQVLGDWLKAGLVRKNESERTIDFRNGGFIGIYSADNNGDSVRGDHFDMVILDEAAMISQDAYYDAILPTLADNNGLSLLISTPRGHNWFYYEWLTGQDTNQKETRSFQAPSSDNPNPFIQKAAELAQERLPERTYRQEWLAQFVEDAGGVYHRINECIRGEIETKPQNVSDEYVIGLDLAKYNDFTVMVVIERRRRQVVDFARFNRIDWALQEEKIVAMHERWNKAQIWLDSTGVGDPIYENLCRRGLPAIGYKFDINSKKRLIDNSVLLVEKQQVWYPNIPVLLAELGAYQYDPLPSGNVRMNAPSGQHDDCVIAFALACWGLQPSAIGNADGQMNDLMDTLRLSPSFNARQLLSSYNF
jgi:hypothetical protein